jgi:hypothetical protein
MEGPALVQADFRCIGCSGFPLPLCRLAGLLVSLVGQFGGWWCSCTASAQCRRADRQTGVCVFGHVAHFCRCICQSFWCSFCRCPITIIKMLVHAPHSPSLLEISDVDLADFLPAPITLLRCTVVTVVLRCLHRITHHKSPIHLPLNSRSTVTLSISQPHIHSFTSISRFQNQTFNQVVKSAPSIVRQQYIPQQQSSRPTNPSVLASAYSR